MSDVIKLDIGSEMNDSSRERRDPFIITWISIIILMIFALSLYLIKNNDIQSAENLKYNLLVIMGFLYPLINSVKRLSITLTESEYSQIINFKNIFALISLTAILICLRPIIGNTTMFNPTVKSFAFILSVGYLLASCQKLINYSGSKDNGYKLVPYIISIIIIVIAISMNTIKNGDGSIVTMAYVFSGVLIFISSQVLGDISYTQEESEIIPSIIALLLITVTTVGASGFRLNKLMKFLGFTISNSVPRNYDKINPKNPNYHHVDSEPKVELKPSPRVPNSIPRDYDQINPKSQNYYANAGMN